MSCLYHRASPEQAWMLRVVEGAVKNALDAHPEVKLSPRFGRSVAKRAIGTLIADRRITLGAGLPLSDKASLLPSRRRRATSSHSKDVGRATVTGGHGRSPFKKLWCSIKRDMHRIAHSGSKETLEAYVELLRALAKVDDLFSTKRGGE